MLAVAVVPDASAELVVLGLLVVVPGIAIEPILDRRVARRLLVGAGRGGAGPPVDPGPPPSAT